VLTSLVGEGRLPEQQKPIRTNMLVVVSVSLCVTCSVFQAIPQQQVFVEVT
jgi:hypothetical protein